jgi:hypothetical protein
VVKLRRQFISEPIVRKHTKSHRRVFYSFSDVTTAFSQNVLSVCSVAVQPRSFPAPRCGQQMDSRRVQAQSCPYCCRTTKSSLGLSATVWPFRVGAVLLSDCRVGGSVPWKFLGTVIPRLTKIIRSSITFVSRNVISHRLSGVSLFAVSNVNNPVGLVGLPCVMWSAHFFVTHIPTEKISSWNGPTVHVCCFMLARASTKTFVSRIHIRWPSKKNSGKSSLAEKFVSGVTR